jgi:hypothetical protein
MQPCPRLTRGLRTPNFDEFYVGALSFHPMSAGLDLWIDDVVLDTKPVACE